MTTVFSLIVLLLCCLIMNFVRYWVANRHTVLVGIVGGLLAAEADVLLNGSALLPYTLILIIAVAAVRFYGTGVVILTATSVLLLWLQTDLSGYGMAAFTVVYVISGAAIAGYAKRKQADNRNKARFEYQQYRQSKQLNIIREVSNVFQSTLEFEQLQHVILTIVTAGYGLGFNRGMLFLVSEDGERLEGVRSLGVMSAEEGILNWIRIVSGNLRMKDFLNVSHEPKENDQPLMELVQSIRLPVRQAGFLTDALRNGRPVRHSSAEAGDPVLDLFRERFQLTEFAAIPLIASGQAIGMLIVDNNINLEPITYDDLDAVIPIADQAASALRNARVYSHTQTQAITDGLTGMYNQRFFEEMLELHLRSHPEMALIVLDIDNFKHYNDTNGHLAGNEVLAQVSRVIKESVRSADIAFRFGGEEFVVILPNTSIDDAACVGERVRGNIEQASFYNEHLQPSGTLTVSIGIAAYPLHRQLPNELLEAADQAMYAAKRTGKNKVVLYGEGGEAHAVAFA